MTFIRYVPDEEPWTGLSWFQGKPTACKGLGLGKATNNPGKEGELFLSKIFAGEREVKVKGSMGGQSPPEQRMEG